MSESNIKFSLEDVKRSKWQLVIASAVPGTHLQHNQIFREQVTHYAAQDDQLTSSIYEFFANLTSIISINIMTVGQISNTRNLRQYLKDKKEYYEKNISLNEFDILAQILDSVSNPEMKAVIADILWLCKPSLDNSKPYEFAKTAIESYLQSSRGLENQSDWLKCNTRLVRAAQISALVDGSKSDSMCRLVYDEILKIIESNRYERHEFLTGSAMKVLQNELRKFLPRILNKYPTEFEDYAAICCQKSKIGKDHANYHEGFYESLAYGQIEAEWYKLCGNRELECKTHIKIAETHVWYADKAIEFEEPSYWIVSAGRLESAIKKLRMIEDKFGKMNETSQWIEQLHTQMLAHQRKFAESMPYVPVSVDFDDPDMRDKARSLVSGKSLEDALFHLTFGCSGVIQNFENLYAEAEKDIKKGRISSLIPTALIDHQGKTKAVSKANTINDKVFDGAKFYQYWIGLNFILPACEKICSEHDLSLEKISFITDENSFIPEGHEEIYDRGLLAGLKSDYLIAAHLLIPQLENSLRHILYCNGFISSNLTYDAIQEEYTLGKILSLPALQEMLHSDIIHSLKGLLVERMGSNARNDICHGLFPSRRFEGGDMAYVWWLILSLCLAPWREKWMSKQAGSERSEK